MLTEKDDLENINFDSDWQCSYQQTINEVDNAAISTLTTMLDDYQWFLVELPHIVDINKRNDTSLINLCNWWYRKQFDWVLSDQLSQKQIYLTFESSHTDNNSNISNTTVIIWLNGTQIFSGSLMSLQKPIELTRNLLHDKESKKNTLLVSCTNMSLCFHARLIVYGKRIFPTGQIQLDEKTIDDNKNSNRKKFNVLQYLVSFDRSDGRIEVQFNDQEQSNEKPTFFSSLSLSSMGSFEVITDEEQTNENNINSDNFLVPRLAIVILIVGTRGDVQPFIVLGKALHAAGHRVRLATHETFRSLVRINGLEFYPLAGDPADLMSYMVKNAGILPSISSIIAGEVAKKRQSLADILVSTWNACTANDDETSLPFTAEAIIANPTSFGHIHCAEKLQIPLHMMFTMPWSPSTAFPHPMCNIDSSKGPTEKINFYSYDVIETLIWTGMKDITNNFRKNILGLTTLNIPQGVRALTDERVPHTYFWSPSIIPKPDDWGPHIDVSGFIFFNLATTDTNPSDDLLDFLGLNPRNGDDHKLTPPIYIGFGSITGHDSSRLLTIIIEALNKTSYRAILAGFATDPGTLPNSIFLTENVSHDWLFQHVSAVCHHGGAGTTAAGLRAGKPTIVVPFFGDQFFWGTAIAKSGAGPKPLPIKTITVDKLTEAFRFVHESTTQEAAERIRVALLKEDGCAAAVRAFHANLPVSRMRSDLEPTFAACYRLDKYKIQISRPVARVLVSAGVIDESELCCHPTREWQFASDNYMHTPAQGILEHVPNALSSMFIDAAIGIRRAADNHDLATGTIAVLGSVGKAFGLGIGHLSTGCLSLYGEMTNALDRAPSRYDRYSEPNTHPQPPVEDFKSGAEAARRSLLHGWKDGITGVVKEPYIGYQRDGIWGGVGGALLGTVNVLVKPVAGTLSSITWLGRGTYASVHKAVTNHKTDGISNSTKTLEFPLGSLTKDEKQQQENDDDDDNEISHAAKMASAVSGYYPKICQQILTEFEKIKMNQEQSTPLDT